PGPLNPRQDLEHHPLLVNPAVSRRGLHHRILAAHVVRGYRHIKPLANPLDNIQVWQRRLHHDHVRALFQVERHLAQCFPRVGRIHLVAAPIAKLRRRLRRFAERPVKSGTILRGIRKNCHVLKSVRVEFLPDRAHSAVHHVRWCHDIRSRTSMRQRCGGKPLDARIIRDVALLDYAAMTVARVFAQANIRDDEKIEFRLSDGVNPPLQGPIRIRSLRANFIFLIRQPEKNHSRNSKPRHFAALLHNLVHRLLENPRHRAHFRPHFRSRAREHRIYQPARRKPRLANESPQRLGAPQSPRPVSRKCHKSLIFFARDLNSAGSSPRLSHLNPSLKGASDSASRLHPPAPPPTIRLPRSPLALRRLAMRVPLSARLPRNPLAPKVLPTAPRRLHRSDCDTPMGWQKQSRQLQLAELALQFPRPASSAPPFDMRSLRSHARPRLAANSAADHLPDRYAAAARGHFAAKRAI